MRLVVDTNVLFTYFWEDSFSKGILVDQDLEFFAPEHALFELKKHQKEIQEKTKISDEDFKKLLRDLATFVEFIPLKEYSQFLSKASSIPDKDDVDFIALALKMNCPIWSNDSHLKEQSSVKVFTTNELIKKLG